MCELMWVYEKGNDKSSGKGRTISKNSSKKTEPQQDGKKRTWTHDFPALDFIEKQSLVDSYFEEETSFFVSKF